ncbi:MAG: putative metalloprotease CJM1_0395 family protein [Pontibacterium sp.]
MALTGVVHTTLFSTPSGQSQGVALVASVDEASASSSSLVSEKSNPVSPASGQKADQANAEPDSLPSGLTVEETKKVEQLAERDREVRQHELAHAATGGQYTGAAQLEYTRGPDGRLYATSGEVSVDTSAIAGDAQATADKMRTVIQAALSPAEPSGQNRQVAAKAQAMLSEALAEIASGADDEAANKTNESGAESEEENTSVSSGDKSGVSGVGTDKSDALQPFGLHTANQEMERRLVDSGVFSKVFPEGSLIQKDV